MKRKSNASSKVDRQAPDKVHAPKARDQATIRRLKMYKSKAVRNPDGKIVYHELQSREAPVARVEPNRKWFGPTRTIAQENLERFRTDLGKAASNPYNVILQQNKVPWGLLTDPKSEAKMNILEVESFQETFGPKKQRKRPRLGATDFDEMMNNVSKSSEDYVEEKDRNIRVEEDMKLEKKTEILDRGKSRRLWNELYKVIDSSDVLIQVLDARDPLGTRSLHIENYLKKEKKHKHLVLLLNKCDLVPTWATARWVKILSKEYPTLAFHASITNPFGKGSLIQLLRQFSVLHSDKKQISIGFVGYPNVGKSSVINTLRAKKVCNVAPIPGETKVWQYITLMSRIFLIDCPGVVPPHTGDTETDIVLKSVIRITNLQDPTEHIPAILQRVKKDYLIRTYGIEDWEDPIDFLTQFAKKSGKLLKGGEPDLSTVSRMMLNDWQRGKIPYFVCPPFEDDNTKKEEETNEVELPIVHQKFSNIAVAQDFVDEDAANLEAEDDEDEDEPDWDEVYNNVKPEEIDNT